MSPSEAVAARLATAVATGDPAVLTTPEAGADAMALLCAATPGPGQDVDGVALASVGRTFAGRGQAGGADAVSALGIAVIIAGVLPPGVDLGLPDGSRAAYASWPRATRDGLFAELVTEAHTGRAIGPGDQAGRLAALETAIAWSGLACATLSPAGDLDQLAAALTHRTRLLTLRAQLAADPDAWAEAAAVGGTLTSLLSPEQAEHGPYLAAAAEAIVRAALILGDPPAGEAERAAALVPAGHQTPATADLLRRLRGVHADPVSWPGEPATRAGSGLLAQGRAGSHAGLLAAASRRFRAALAVTPADHPAHARLARELRNAAVAFAVAGGPGLPADAVLAAFVLELHRLTEAAGSRPSQLTVSDGWLAGYESAFARLPPDHRRRREHTVILAAASGVRADEIRPADPERAARLADRVRQLLETVALSPQCSGMLSMKEGTFVRALGFAAYLTPWPEVAVSVTAPGPRPDVATDLADAFGAMDDVLGGADGLPGAFRDLIFLDLSPAGDTLRAEAHRRLAALAERIPDDRRARRGTLIALMGATLSEVAARRQDPDIAREAADLILRAITIDPGLRRNTAVTSAFAVALTLDPGRVLQQWDAQEQLAATALLAGVQVDENGAGLVHLAIGKAMGELLVAAMTLAAQYDHSQLRRIHDLADRVRDLARRAGPEAEERYIPVMDALVVMMNASAEAMVALPELRAAQVVAATIERFRPRLAALPAGHQARPMLEAILAVQLREQADLAGLGPEDPVAAGLAAGSRAEAESLISSALAAMPASQAALVERYFSADSPIWTGKARQQITAAFGQAADDPEAFAALMRDPGIPVRYRVHEGLSTAVRVLDRSAVPRSLDYAELAVELMSQISDRGSDHQSAEYAFAGLMPAHPEQYLSGLLSMLRRHRDAIAEQAPERLAQLVAMQEAIVVRAAALAERARGVLLARQFESRTDLGELEAADPGLAGQYARLVTELAADPDTLAGLRPASDPPAIGRPEWARLEKLRLSREMDALIARVRDIPGFESFQRGLDPFQLFALAAHGPVVLLTYPGWPGKTKEDAFGRPCAFIVTTESIAAFPLDDGFRAYDAAAARWRAAIADITARGAQRPGVARLRQARDDLTEVLSWTWHHVTGPVLAALNATGFGPRGQAAAGQGAGGWPRVWWIPDGPLNALPLHAAQCQLPGCRLGGCGSALDLIVSSYVPSFRTLAHARSRASRPRQDNEAPAAAPAADAVSDGLANVAEGADGADRADVANGADVSGRTDVTDVTDGAAGPVAARGRVVIVAATDDELPGAETAAREAAGRLGVSAGEILAGDEATRERVLARLGDATWAHFGCHATSDPRQPSSGTLHLPSGETLTVREMIADRSGKGRPGAARLAFLTACGTARTSERLAAEAIHLTSAFLVAGFTEVIGTLWEIDSASARQVTSAFYERVTGPAPEPAAVALHHCAREIRRQRPAEPHAWAAYIHSGA